MGGNSKHLFDKSKLPNVQSGAIKGEHMLANASLLGLPQQSHQIFDSREGLVGLDDNNRIPWMMQNMPSN